MNFVQNRTTVLGFNDNWKPDLSNVTSTALDLKNDWNPRYIILGIAALILFFIWTKSAELQNPSRLPVIGRKWYELGYGKARRRFQTGAPRLVKDCLEKYGDAFYLYTDSKFHLILSYKYADAIRYDNRLSFMKAIQQKLNNGVHGFEPHAHMSSDKRFLRDMVKQVLTRSLASVIEPINSECDDALRRNWSDSDESQEFMLKETMWKILGQIISKTYFNDESVHRNPEWIRLSTEYIKESFVAAHELRSWPKPIWGLVANFHPRTKFVRRQLKQIRQLLKPFLLKLDEAKEGKESKTPIEWLHNAFQGQSPDIVSMIISLCMVSYDAGTEAVTHLISDLSGKDQLIHDLRAEILDVVGKEGFTKSSLQNLTLMDSVMKESQRLHPESYLLMQRQALEEVTLPDGIVIPKDTLLMISATHMMMDSSVWSDGDKFDGYRFFNLRQKSDKAAQASHYYVTTSPEQIAFGHGNQACAGRFFASYLIKIILCHILLKYDFSVKAPEEGRSRIARIQLLRIRG
ncbi:hypothetical protein N7532_002389 [Penicillium argentinense]|uniref:Cytochrome P450 n=1 Tax=Penicillium argentinense TaxID=1131581 RepID=A0A9W9G0B6_9EURO|nr:uncharacterized protein N7532_002389 [Penicillium argentinense]KAJ5109744.1 hypothetical protein N7532_002389 [Penicillium argentinense]